MVEILQNCVIFFNKVHEDITSRETKEENQLYLRHGEPMIFGKEMNKGIVLRGTRLEVVKIGENGITEKDILVHNEKQRDPGIHVLLANMSPPDFPAAMGVIRSVSDFTYEDKMSQIMKSEKETNPIQTMDDLLNSGKTWDI